MNRPQCHCILPTDPPFPVQKFSWRPAKEKSDFCVSPSCLGCSNPSLLRILTRHWPCSVAWTNLRHLTRQGPKDRPQLHRAPYSNALTRRDRSNLPHRPGHYGRRFKEMAPKTNALVRRTRRSEIRTNFFRVPLPYSNAAMLTSLLYLFLRWLYEDTRYSTTMKPEESKHYETSQVRNFCCCFSILT